MTSASSPPIIHHHASCSPNYPEKLSTERPQELVRIDIGNGEEAIQCIDCGAYIVMKAPTGETRR